MTLSSRRQFLRQTSLWGAALYGGHTSVPAAARVLDGRKPDVAGIDAATMRKFACQIDGHVITPEMPGYDSSRRCLTGRLIGTQH